MSRLDSRVLKLEEKAGVHEDETYVAMFRWRHPEHEWQGRQWGWNLRDKLGLRFSHLRAYVASEGATDEPEVIVAPQLLSDMSEGDLDLIAMAFEPGPWCMLTIREGFVFGDPMPEGLHEYLRKWGAIIAGTRTDERV